jgi:hypothetical protein
VLADNALLVAFAKQAPRVSTAMLREAARDVGLAAGDEPAAAPEAQKPRENRWLGRIWPRRRLDDAART